MTVPRTNIAARMGRWSAQHRKLAILGWLAFVVTTVLLGGVLGTPKLQPGDEPSGEAARAQKMIERAGFPEASDESVIIQSETLRVPEPRFRAVVNEVVARVSTFEGVRDVRSPLAGEDAGLVSADGRSVLVQFAVAGDAAEAEEKVAPVVAAVERLEEEHPGFVIEQFGPASYRNALQATIDSDFQRAEKISVPVTLGVLVVAFSALVAAGIPLLLGLSAVAAALGFLAIPSHAFPASDASASVVLLIGLAVGVDYSLFYLKREREERAAGRGGRAALEAAAATSGRAVLVSGLTVIVALSGMFLTGNAVFTSIAIGTVIVVAIASAGSLTVLPALLSWLGDRVEKGRIPHLGRLRSGDESRLWGAVVDRVLRRPLLATLVAGGGLLALALPTLWLHTAAPGIHDLPRELAIRQTYERIQTAFPGGPVPAIVAVEAGDVTTPSVEAAIRHLRERALATGQMQEPIRVQVNDAETVAQVSIPLAGSGTGDTSNRALATLRSKVIPETVGKLDGVDVAVAGDTALSKDFNERIKERAPIVFAFVLALAFVLLLAAFRSLVIAAKAIVLNLLSVGAAYGLLVALFQWGWGESLLGFESTGSIVSWLPLFLFVVLFGLSMDYHVFILSRIREAFDRGFTTEEAIRHGIKTTASVVTAAAAVMVAVVSVFATLSTVEMKQAGVGLAAAVLIDATIVRAVLLPAAMKMLGSWNWYLPSKLEWLPRVAPEIERPRQAAPALDPSAS